MLFIYQIFIAAIFIFGAKYTEKVQKRILLGFFLFVQICCYILILFNLPAESTVTATFSEKCVLACIAKTPQKWPAVLAAVFMGLSDIGLVD